MSFLGAISWLMFFLLGRPSVASTPASFVAKIISKFIVFPADWLYHLKLQVDLSIWFVLLSFLPKFPVSLSALAKRFRQLFSHNDGLFRVTT